MIKLNPQISELIGMHVGDGSLYNTSWGLVWEIRGDLKESEYYINHINKLLENIFVGEFFKPKFRSGGKNGCFGIQTSNKKVSSFFLNYDFKPGRKSHTVRIPDYIKKSNKDIKLAFIRGYFDTDGYLRFERINNNKKYTYPKIEFCTVSKNLRDDLFLLLIELGFRPYKWGKNVFKICLAGIDNLEKFVKEVSSKNKKHLNKYLRWRIQGYDNPGAGVA